MTVSTEADQHSNGNSLPSAISNMLVGGVAGVHRPGSHEVADTTGHPSR
jgi:hypothetical protein